MSDEWAIHDLVGDAAQFHSADTQPRRSATFYMAPSATLVLGSAQRDADVDRRVADALGIEVVKRRSGGGAVLLVPNEYIWLDLVIPSDDPLWRDDIGQAMLWVGELWQRALADLGIDSTVHDAQGTNARWARQVCFAGLGRGEVVRDGRKLVGVSQRRTRATARFQSQCHLRWRPELVAALVAAPRPSATELAAQVATVSASAVATRDALARWLPVTR